MRTSIQVRNEMRELRDCAQQAVADSASADSAVADRGREDALRIDGRMAALEDELDRCLAEEADMRADGAVPFASAAPKAAAAPRRLADVARALLGDAAGFHGMAPGEKRRAPGVMNAIDLPNPLVTERTLPVLDLSGLSPFVSTLAQGTTDADVKYFQATSFVNKAASWKKGTQKAQSDVDWTPKTAQLDIVAHHVPVPKPAVNRYGQLEDILSNQLLTGLEMAKDSMALTGSNAEGITGILNFEGVQAYTAREGDNVADSIRRMATLSILSTGFYPDHVAVAPQVKEHLDLMKTAEGVYLNLVVGGRLWGIPVVEDVNLYSVEGKTEHYGALVYTGRCATWFTADDAEVTTGLVDSQFIENAFTMLAESTHALKVPYPTAFIHMKDAIATTTTA